MKVVTTHHGPKPFTWSYSRLKNFETCPKRHWHVDIAKDAREEQSEQLLWGNQVHAALAARLSKNVPLPPGMDAYEKWCVRILATPGELLVEQRLAITKDFAACGFFDGNVWFRGIGDVIKVTGTVGLIADWKTGKIIEDSQQLALSAACLFAMRPELTHVRSEFIWLKEGASSRIDIARADMPGMWKSIWPRIENLKHAHETMHYPANPGPLCRNWCPVKQCPHNGE